MRGTPTTPVLATSSATRYSRISSVQRLARIIFPHYWECISLAAATGEWTLLCWAFGLPTNPLVHVVGLAVLLLVNRVAAIGYETEDVVAPVRHRVGGVVLAAGIMSTGGVTGLVVGVVAWACVARAGGLAAQAGTLALSSHEWLGPEGTAAGWIGVLVGIGFVAQGYLRGYRRLDVTRLEITLPNLPATLDGFRIVQVSDIHLGPIADRSAVVEALEAATAEAPDLIVVTGDVVDTPRTDCASWLPELRRLRARHGVVAILGNHDEDSGLERVADEIRQATDWTLLRDAVHRLELAGGALHVVGLEFRRTPHEGDAVARLAATLPAGAATLLLVHHPNAFPAAVDAGLPLTLAGHTHGGQIALPMAPRWNPARLLMTPYDGGTFEQDGCVLHVNRGLGTSGQRMRIAVPREITVVTLRAPDAGVDRA
jgi:predicted MPP superfamily phosphohydrolase